MVVEAARQDPELRRFRLRRHKVPTAAGLISIVCVKSIDELLDRVSVAEYDRDGQLPYWGEVWPVSVALLRLVLRGPSLAGRTALDLGCGVGTAGVGAGRHGAHVVFADLDPRALPFAAFNARHNGVASCTTRAFDWRHEGFDRKFDLILCADVVYEPRNHAPILDQIARHLAPGGEALVADPYRAPADAFFDAAAARFASVLEDSTVHFAGVRRRVRIVRLRHHG